MLGYTKNKRNCMRGIASLSQAFGKKKKKKNPCKIFIYFYDRSELESS